MTRYVVALVIFVGMQLTNIEPAQGQQELGSDSDQLTTSHEKAHALAFEYVKLINCMNVDSATLYVVFATANQATNAEPETLNELIELTTYHLERARFAHTTHLAFAEHADEASKLRRRLIESLKEYRNDISNDLRHTTFEDHRIALLGQRFDLEELIKGIQDTDVTLPDNYEAMERYVRESIVVLERAVETDGLRLVLSAENYSNAAMQLGLEQYKDDYRQWLVTKLKGWREVQLPGIYRSIKTKEPEPKHVLTQVKAATVQYAVYHPGRTDMTSQLADANFDDSSDVISGVFGWAAPLFIWIGRILLVLMGFTIIFAVAYKLVTLCTA